MKNKYFTLFVVLILLGTSLSTANAFSIKKENQTTNSRYLNDKGFQICFSEKKLDATDLDIDGIIKTNKLSNYEYDSLQTQKINIKLSECSFHQRDYGRYFLEIKGLQLIGAPGEPILPMKSITFEIPKNARIVDVVFSDAYYVEIKNRVRITPVPKPFILEYPEDKAEEYFNDKIKPKIELYGSDDFFPGEILKYQCGKTRDKQLVIVQLFPAQYIPREGKLVLITEGVVTLLYKNAGESSVTSFPSSSAENIIITSEELYNQALDLESFHDAQGIETEVVKTSWINENYNESDDPDYPGYKDEEYRDTDVVVGYNYSLAKKIISYLNNETIHPNLKYVTLFGTAKQVPPSYYFYEHTGEFIGYPIGWSWVPTDLFYASPDLDLIPNYFVGRIPVRNVEEATHVINKIKNWSVDNDFFENVYLTGGTTFDSPYILGEAIIADMINKGYFDGSNISTYYETDGKFNPESLKDVFENKSGFFYHLGHGSGITLDAGNGTLLPKDMLGLSKNNRSNVFMSISCLNGAYDTKVVDISSSSRYNFSTSFGESVLLSNSAGICYIGSSRVTLVGIIFNLEKGQLKIYEHKYFSKLAESVLKSYRNGIDTLGNLTTNAMIEYQKSVNMSKYWNIYTLFEFTLLGDPALKLPEKPEIGSTYNISNLTANNPINYHRISRNGSIPIYANKEKIEITSKTNASKVEIKIVDPSNLNDLVIKRENLTVIEGEVDFNFTPNLAILHLFRIITPDKKEGWLYVYVARVVDNDYTPSTPGYGETKWSTIQEAIDDFEESTSKRQEIIYVFNGTYKENIKIRKDLVLLGENKYSTIINGKGRGSVIDVASGSYEISGFTITRSSKLRGNAGIAVKIGVFSLTVSNCIINNNKNGVYIGKSTKGITVIVYNTITNNTYGININAEKRVVFSNTLVVIDANIIQDNIYGIFLKKTGFVLLSGGIGIDVILHNTLIHNQIGVLLFMLTYSYLIACTGSNFAAFQDGYSVAKKDKRIAASAIEIKSSIFNSIGNELIKYTSEGSENQWYRS